MKSLCKKEPTPWTGRQWAQMHQADLEYIRKCVIVAHQKSQRDGWQVMGAEMQRLANVSRDLETLSSILQSVTKGDRLNLTARWSLSSQRLARPWPRGEPSAALCHLCQLECGHTSPECSHGLTKQEGSGDPDPWTQLCRAATPYVAERYRQSV